MKIIVSHPTGNQNVRAVLDGFDRAGILARFITTIAFNPKSWLLKILPKKAVRECMRRSYNINFDLIDLRPERELLRNILPKVGMKSAVSEENGFASIDSVYLDLDQTTAKTLIKVKNLDAVYLYEDGALETFSSAAELGVTKIYDLPIGYWRSMRRLLAEERDKNPDWAITLGGFSDSDEKLRRKDQELKLADQIYVASTFTKKTLEEYPGRLAEIKVIPYGFPTVNQDRKYLPVKGRKIKLLYVGGLSQRKGISYLFEAVKGLEEQVELTVVGRGNIEGCPALKAALKLHHYIPALPNDEILKLMATQDLFIFPSLFEGFGLVITEAMSQGTPVITTDRTCGPDIIRNNENGWLVESGSSTAIKQKLEELLADPAELERVGRQAAQTAFDRPWSQYGKELTLSIQQRINAK